MMANTYKSTKFEHLTPLIEKCKIYHKKKGFVKYHTSLTSGSVDSCVAVSGGGGSGFAGNPSK